MVTTYGILTRILEAWHKHELRRVFRKLTRGGRVVVRSGPFEGMELAPDVDSASNLNKVVGSYEAELHRVIGELVSRPPRAIVNIGAAEGYYAVGLARRIAGCRVYAFETDRSQQRHCAAAARLNGVQDRVVVLGKCNARALVGLDLRDAALVVDCEGAEVDILQPSQVPPLTQARLLVELHDAIRPGCSRVLWERFRDSHDMTFISAAARNPSDYTCLDTFRRRDKMLAVEENRLGVQAWMFGDPKKTSCA